MPESVDGAKWVVQWVHRWISRAAELLLQSVILTRIFEVQCYVSSFIPLARSAIPATMPRLSIESTASKNQAMKIIIDCLE